jgi:hypothetical protein
MNDRSNPAGVAREKEVALMRRILLVMTVAAVVAALMLASALPVFAQGRSETAPNCEKGNNTAYFSPGSEHRNDQATESLDKNYFGKCTQ